MMNLLKNTNFISLLTKFLCTIFTLTACQSVNQISNNNLTNKEFSADGNSSQILIIEEEVSSIINSIDFTVPDTLYFPEKIIALGHDAVPALINLLESESTIKRWAAVYALTRISQPEDIPGLMIGLEDENIGFRTRIAATLLWLGDESGVPQIEESLLSNEMMLFSHPPENVADYAHYVLRELKPEILEESGYQNSKVLSAPFPIPLNDISVSKDDCDIKIELKLQFTGAGATEKLAAIWKSGIVKMWDDQESSYCCKTSLTVLTKVGGATDPTYAQINVVKVPPGGEHRSSNSVGGSVYWGNSDDISGDWASNDGPKVAAHEAGHGMGVSDEYRDVGKFSEPTGEAIGESYGTGIPGIMAQTQQDNEKQDPEAKPRHIDQILKFYEVVCICCGIIKIDITNSNMSMLFEAYTCDGYFWDGTITEELAFAGTTAHAEAEFVIEVSEETNSGEIDFPAEGSWIADGEEIGFQDNLHFNLSINSDLTAETDIYSNGGVLLAGGQSIPVPQAMPNSFGKNILEIKKLICE